MSDQEGNPSGLEGAEGGRSSSDEYFDDYEVVAEEEYLDTSWESSEVHPERHYPRPAFGASGHHPELSLPRVVLTDGPTASPKRARSVQTEPVQEQIERERSQEEPGEQATAAAADPRPPQEQQQEPDEQAAVAAAAESRPPQEQQQPGEQAAAVDPTPPLEQRRGRSTLKRRIKEGLERMRLRSSSSRGDSPHKPPRDESPPSTKQ